MRLVTFVLPDDPTRRLGCLDGPDRVRDLREAARRHPLPFDPGDMVSLIAGGEAALAAVRAAAPGAPAHPLETLRLLAPIPRPRKNVFCVGWNYQDHFGEGAGFRPSDQELPRHPVFFTKVPTSVTGPYDPIPVDPAVSIQIDWEVELAVVIGRPGKNLSEAEAPGHLFGYTILNDVSARDLQLRHGGQWHKGKSLDASSPMGPWIVTADELDPIGLRVVTRVNGAVKQDSNTRHLYFGLPRLLAELSLGMTLEPGDILSTGTPEGVGFARQPPEYLQPGDLVETEIERIGCLRNRVATP